MLNLGAAPGDAVRDAGQAGAEELRQEAEAVIAPHSHDAVWASANVKGMARDILSDICLEMAPDMGAMPSAWNVHIGRTPSSEYPHRPWSCPHRRALLAAPQSRDPRP